MHELRPWERRALEASGIKPISFEAAQAEAGKVSHRHSVGDCEGDVCVSAHHEADCAPADKACAPCDSRGCA